MKLSLQEFAYDKCKSLIEAGDLSPGTLYSEVSIARQLGISRTPMRTALQNLEKDGLIIRLPQRGFYVYQFTDEDIRELFAIRKALEGYAVETIAKEKLKINVDRLNSHINRQQQALQSDNFTAFIREDRKFHEQIVHALKNRRLTTIYSDLRQSIELLGLQRFKLNSQRNLSIKEHTAIIQQIVSGDPTASRTAIYNHLDSALLLLIKNELE